MIRTAFLAAVAATLCSGCVRYYKTDQINRTFSKTVLKLDKLSQRMARDLSQRRKLLGQLPAPPPELGSAIGQMQQVQADLHVQRKKLVTLHRRFGTVAHGRRRIRSDRPGWEETQQVKKEAEQIRDVLNDCGSRYQAAVKRFNEGIPRRR